LSISQPSFLSLLLGTHQLLTLLDYLLCELLFYAFQVLLTSEPLHFIIVDVAKFLVN